MQLQSPERVHGNDSASRVELTDPYRLRRVFQEIHDTLDALAEAGHQAPATFGGFKRAKLMALMELLDVDTSEGEDNNILSTVRAGLRARAHNPQPYVAVPGMRFFANRIGELMGTRSSTVATDKHAMLDTDIQLSDVASHGQLNWNKLISFRQTTPLAKQARDVARLMADPVAYHMCFADLRLPYHLRSTDHLGVGNNWHVENGHKRALAAICLGPEFIVTSGMDQWVPVRVAS